MDDLYLQSGPNGSLALKTNIAVVFQINSQKALIFLQNTTRKAWLAGVLIGVKMHGKSVSIVGAHFSGGSLNGLEKHGKQCASQLLSGVKTHQEYVCVGGGSMWVAFMRMGNPTKTSANQHGEAGHGDNGGRGCK